MKKLVLIFALIAISAVGAKAQQVVLDPKTIPLKVVPTIPGENYIITPVSGAYNELDHSPFGCDSGGANCFLGFEFSYSFNNSGVTTIKSDIFETASLAFDSAQVIGFTAVNPSVEFSVPCVPCSDSIGVMTLDVALESLLPSPGPGAPGVSEGLGPDFTFVADDLAQLSVDFTPCDDGGCEFSGPESSVDQFNPVLAACNEGACDSLFDEGLFQTAYGCAGSSCNESEIVQQELSGMDMAQIGLLDPRKVILKYVDLHAANLAFEETAFALAGLLSGESDRNQRSMTLFMVSLYHYEAAKIKYIEKRQEFDRTEKGAALILAKSNYMDNVWETAGTFASDQSDASALAYKIANSLHDAAVAAYEGAAAVFAPDEYQASQRTGNYWRQVNAQLYGDYDFASDEREADDPTGIQEVLDAQNQLDMTDEIESVIPELADIVVIAQAGPVRTYAAADGPATIVTAFADTR